MDLTITRETPVQDDVRRFVAELNAHLQPLSPPEFQFQMTVEQMAGPDTHVFVARDDTGKAVGMGALKTLDVTTGELKRMYTLPEVRGQRVGKEIVETLETYARSLGLTQLKLETGAESFMPEAHRLYRRSGYTPCPAFADYPNSDYSAFYERAL